MVDGVNAAEAAQAAPEAKGRKRDRRAYFRAYMKQRRAAARAKHRRAGKGKGHEGQAD